MYWSATYFSDLFHVSRKFILTIDSYFGCVIWLIKLWNTWKMFIEQLCRDLQSSIMSRTQKHFLLYTPGQSEVFRHKHYKLIAAALHYRAARRNDIDEFDSKVEDLWQPANEFDRAASQKQVTLTQLEIEAARKILSKDS